MQASTYAELLQQLPVNSNLFEWKSYDPPRQFLLVTQSEKQDWSPSLWTSNIAPRWKSVLCDFILTTKSSNIWDRLRNEVLDDAVDKLVLALIEFLNAILFFRITSHQALEFLRDVFDHCNKHLCGSHKTNLSLGNMCSSDFWYVSESRKNESAIKGLSKPIGKIPNNFNNTTFRQSDTQLLLTSTQIHTSFLDALRWSIEYATELSDQLSGSAAPRLETSKSVLSLPNSSSSHNRSSMHSKIIDSPRYQQRIFHVLDVVEKSGILSLVEIIANIPCSQLDHVGFCKTRDQLPLMKFYVRLRTKDVFTLPVYNLESENTLGYAKLHVCLQAFISNSYDYDSCGCWKSTMVENSQDDGYSKNVRCPIARGLVVHVEKTIVNFQLCVNRVVMIFLLYMAHYLCVVRHSLLDVLFELVPKEKIIFCFKFLLTQTEKNLSYGKLSSRDIDTTNVLAYKPYPLPISYSFFNLCAYFHMEGLLSLEELWNLIGPSELFFVEIVKAATQTAQAKQKNHEDIEERVACTERYMNVVPSVLSSEEAFSFITTQSFGKLNLIVSFINLNAWSCAMTLLKHIVTLAPDWSLHLSMPIMEALGSLLCWTLYSFCPGKPYSNLNNTDVSKHLNKNVIEGKRSSAIGAYISPYDYGMHSTKNYKSLSPVISEEDFRLTCIPILQLLGPASGQLPSAIFEYIVKTVVCMLKLFKKQNFKNSHTPFPECYAKLYSHILLPSIALARPTISITEKIWSGLQLFSVKERYSIYADYYFNVKKNIPILVSSSQAVRRIIGRELKRVTADKTETSGPPVLFTASNAGLSVMGDIVVKQKKRVTHSDKTVMDSLLKLCCANPFEVVDVILHHVELFDSMLIQVIINYLHKLPDLICDITVFLVTVRQHFLELSEQGAWSPGNLKPKRARNIAHFIARFMRRFQAANVNPLLLSISSRIIKETTSPAYPNKLSGKYCDILFLVELITYMGSVLTLSTEELSSDQVDCIGAGPGLRVMILMDEERRDELYRPGALEARVRLQIALLQKDVFTSLLFGLSKLRLEVQYDCQLLCEERFLQLRSVVSLTDEVQIALFQLLQFILFLEPSSKIEKSDNITVLTLPPEKFAKVLPAFSKIVQFCELAMVWLLVRGVLPPLYMSITNPNPVTEESLNQDGLFPITEQHLELIAKKYYIDSYPGMNDLYITFWRLDLHDIWCPSDIYDKHISFIEADLKQITADRRSSAASHQRRRASDDVTIQKELNLCVQRLSDWKTTFETESAILKTHQSKVIESLKEKKNKWFQPEYAGPNALANFLQHMLAPRILNSQKDALYCVKFVHMLVEMDTEGFVLMDFFNKWTGMLTPLVRSCSLQEADSLGLFFNDMTSIINQWIRDPLFLSQFIKENRHCYVGLITKKTVLPKENADDVSSNTTMQTSDEESTVLDSSDLLKIIGKWENRIFRVIQHGLSLTERETSWMSQRIVIKFLNTTHKNFPITNIAGNQILRALPVLIERAKESRWDDVVANARALDRNLRLVESRWLKRKEEDYDQVQKSNFQGVNVNTLPETEEKPEVKKINNSSLDGKLSFNAGVSTNTSTLQSRSNFLTQNNSFTQKSVAVPSAITKGPKNPFHGSSTVVSGARTNIIGGGEATSNEFPKRALISHTSPQPLTQNPDSKRLKINQEGTSTVLHTDEKSNNKQMASTMEKSSKSICLSTSISSSLPSKQEIHSDETDGKGDTLTQSNGASCLPDTSNKHDNVKLSLNRSIENSKKVIETDQLVPKPVDSTVLKGATNIESEERKFEKQKEIEALRQRMKSLHTYRSKSASGDGAKEYFDNVDTKDSKTPSQDIPSQHVFGPNKGEGTNSSSKVEDVNRKQDKASGWSSKEESSVQLTKSNVNNSNAMWSSSSSSSPDGTKLGKSSVSVSNTKNATGKTATSSLSLDDTLKKKKINDAFPKRVTETRWSLPKESASLESKKDANWNTSGVIDFMPNRIFNGCSLQSRGTNEKFSRESSRTTRHSENSNYPNGQSTSRSRGVVTKRLPPPPPPPPPPVSLVLPMQLRHLEGASAKDVRNSISTPCLHGREYCDLKPGLDTSLLQKPQPNPLRNSQACVADKKTNSRLESHHDQARYINRSLVSKSSQDGSGRWHHIDYSFPQPNSPTWNDVSHQRTTTGWCRNMLPSGSTVWSMYERSHGQPIARDPSRDHQSSQSSLHHNYNHHPIHSENVQSFYNQQKSPPLFKRRQDTRSMSLDR